MDDKSIKLLIASVIAVETELKNRENVILNLRVRLKGTLNHFGLSCFTCLYLQNTPHVRCKDCTEHCNYISMF